MDGPRLFVNTRDRRDALASTRARVRALLARATHEAAVDEEARTSAIIAAKLILAHDLLEDVELPGRRDELDHERMTTLEREVQEQRRENAMLLAEVERLNEVTQGLLTELLDSRTAARAAEPEQPWMSAAEERGERGRSRRGETSSADGYDRSFRSNYDGVCRACGARYRQGELIAWRRGVGATHMDCKEYWKTV